MAEDQDNFDSLLDDFIAKQLADTDDNIEDIKELQSNSKPLPVYPGDEAETISNLYPEERRLYDAYHRFKFAVINIANTANVPLPEFKFTAMHIYPRYRPNRTQDLNQDIFDSWNVLVQAQPVRLSSLPENPSDEQLLNFAEKTSDENLQNAIISYVEILIEVDGCEIAYNMRKAKAQKRRIEKKIYEDHLRRKERIQKYIEAIKIQHFPIDAERLVNNFFKTARKDPDGAQKILESNPATYAPIQVDKIPPRFFGMIKAKPEDGIRINKKIGNFLKNLKI